MQSIDIGNAFTLSFNGRHYNEARSCITTIPTKLNYRGGDGRIEYSGKLYHIGDSALKYPQFRSLAENDKQVDILDSVVLTLAVLPNKGKVEQETGIVLQVPNTLTTYQHELVKALNDSHIWIQDGKQYCTRIQVKQVYQEGFGSWYVAKRSKLLPEVGYTLVLDIGGGTSIVSMIDNQTAEVMPNVSTYQKRGVIGLANMLRDDLEFRLSNSGNIPSVTQIFTAIEEGTFQVGHNGTNFKEKYEFYSKEWFNALFKGAVVNDFQEFFIRREITKILITGGGSHVVRPMVEAAISKPGIGRLFAMSPNPLTDNVTGIYHAYNQG